MTTIVNTPAPSNESNGGIGMIIGLIAFIVVAYLFVVIGLPAIRQMQVGTPQINIPSQIDVNIQQPK